jgi:probable HAF family extracellular repeat protein
VTQTRMKYVIRLLVSMLVVTLSAAAQKYTITNLSTLQGFTSSYADDNNNTGLITGCSDNSVYPAVPCSASNLPADAFLWSSTGGMQNLDSLGGADMTMAYVVNDSSEVVGFSGSSQTGGGHGFYWSPLSGIHDLGTLTGSSGYSVASAITSKGVIVGESSISNGDVNLVLWTKSNQKYHIQNKGHAPWAPYIYAYDISEKLEVTGIAYLGKKGVHYHGFLWSNGTWKDLGTLPGGTDSYGDWINSSSVIAGLSNSPKYPNGVVVYWDASGIHSIGTLKGGSSSAPGFISDTGQILGDSTVAGGASHAFIWTKGKLMQDLNNMIPKNSGWVLHHASSISNSGQIVGYGTINGVNQAFLLTPKP